MATHNREGSTTMPHVSEIDYADVLERILRDRWSCRAFEDRAVDSTTIERMLRIAQRSPSWCNTQPWNVIVTSGAGTARLRTRLAAHIAAEGPAPPSDFDTPRQYTGTYRERRQHSGRQLYDALDIDRADRPARDRQAFRNWELFGAPHVAIITTAAEQGTYGAVDAGVYTGCLLLAAQSLGLGAVPQGAIAYAASFLRQHFDIPDDRKVLLAVAFGYPAIDHPVNSYRTDRATLGDVVRFVDD